MNKKDKVELTFETREISVWDETTTSAPRLLFTYKVSINHIAEDVIIKNIDVKYKIKD